MGRQALALGGAWERSTQPQSDETRTASGSEQVARESAHRWRARCYHRGHDGVTQDVSARGKSKRLAIEAVEVKLAALGRMGDAEMTATMPLVTAGELWLKQIKRSDANLAPSTVKLYSESFARHINVAGSSIRGLTLAQANDPQRLRIFLQGVADSSGNSTAKLVKSVLSGVLNLAVENGVLTMNAMRQIRPVKSQKPKRSHL